MSLINDALKRVKQSQSQNPFGGQPTVPLQPVEYAARPNWFFRVVGALLVLASLVLSAWFFGKWWRSGGEPEPAGGGAGVSKAQSAKKPSVPSATPNQVIKVSTNIVVRTNFVAPQQSETAAQ